ncbi:hypothetical protein HK105_207454 [Polyrhizophydium stewartii]|uniref:Protein FAM184A/B N-terminal domain-containing protein n=1 Tax=Polyrhizophydium stewartii TaxID=2732419 RepID=A0ABR4N0E2_9FUNG
MSEPQLSKERRSRSDREGDASRSASMLSLVPKGPEIPPDILFKMSKKIAQLTKVIYYLNTKNEDHALEVQGLVDAYELEINDVIQDGAKMIDEFRLKWEESELKIKAQEDVILSYLETVKKQESELKTLQELERKLRSDLSRVESSKPPSEAKARKPTDPAPVEKKTVVTVAADDQDIRQEYEGKIANTISQYEQRLQSMKLEWSTEVEDLRSEHTKKMRLISEEKQKIEESLRASLDDVKSKTLWKAADAALKSEEESTKLHSEVRRLKQILEEQEKESKSQLSSLETRLRSALEEEHHKVVEKDALLADLRAGAIRKDERLNELEQETTRKTKAVKELNEKLSQISFDTAAFKDQNERLQKQNQLLESQTAELSYELSKKTLQVQEAEAACMQAVDESQHMAAEISKLSSELGTMQLALQDVSEKAASLEEGTKMLKVEIADRDERIKQMSEEHQALKEQNIKDIENALSRLTETMTTDKYECLSKLAAEMERSKLEALSEKSSELQRLTEDICATRLDYDQRIVQLQLSFDSERSELAHLTLTVKTLEVDKADLFQKMVHIDRQIRGEMQEKFQKEKSDLENQWRDQHQDDLEQLREALAQQHEQELDVAVAKVKVQYSDEIHEISGENQTKMEGFLSEMSEKEAAIAQLQSEKDDLERTLDELKQAHAKAIEDLQTDHRQYVAQEKAKWESELQAKETQLKVASTIALSNLEKKYTLAQTELEASHKKQVDELRSFHTISALAAKKEAETLRQLEINRLKSTHADQVAALAQEREKMLADLALDLNTQRNNEIQALTEDFNSTIDSKDEAIRDLEAQVGEKEDKIASLKSQISALEQSLSDLKGSLESTVDSMRQQETEFQRQLDLRAVEFDLHLKKEIENIKTEHVREMQLMLQDFEKAKAFLKKQIANQAKQLQDAEIKYINREPREADLAAISQLEQSVAGLNRRISALSEELEYYRLEMNNREANFNKIFNKSPIVGLMQPLAVSQKKPKQKERPDASSSNPKLPPLFSISSGAGTPPDYAAISG